METVKMTRAEYLAKYGSLPGAASTTSQNTPVAKAPVAPTTPPGAPTATTVTPVKMSKAEYEAKYGTPPPTSVAETPENKGSSVGNFVKNLVSAPATLIARPIQLAAELAGATPEQVNKVNLGGLIAPVPEHASDVVKDVGRGVETVALGVGSPVAAGTAFGAGSALENQGSDILSKEGAKDALVSTVAGAAGGKILGLVGKPLLDAAGKVIGTITPQIVKDVTARGSEAVSQFVARHEIVPAAAKPAINAIPKIAEKADESVNKLFKGAGAKVKETVQTQYPNVTKENLSKHYEKIEVDRLIEPATAPGKTYNKAADVFNDAKKKGIDLRKVAANNKVYASEHITDGKFDTAGVADALANETMSGGPQIFRPALRAAAPGVERVPISEVRNEMLSRLSKVPDAKLSPKQKLAFARKIVEEYGDASPTAARYKDGYDLENLYDSKLQTSGSLYKTPKGGGVQSIGDSLTVQQKQLESQVFDDLLRKKAPKELGLDKYFKAQQERFALANYLRTLDGNKAPQTLFQRGVRRASQLAGATTGATVAGPFGMFSGYQFGGIVADTFANASNPVKISFLKSIGKTEPEIYQIMKDFVKKSDLDKLLRPKLEAPITIFQGPTQGGKPFTPNSTGFKTTPVVETKRIFKGKK